jgi:hypothetical protein
MMGGRNPGQNAPPHIKKQQQRLYILGAVHFILSFMFMWVDSYQAMYEMIACMELLIAACSLNFCFLLFYLVIMINDTMQYLCAIGLIIYRGDFATYYRVGKGY